MLPILASQMWCHTAKNTLCSKDNEGVNLVSSTCIRSSSAERSTVVEGMSNPLGGSRRSITNIRNMGWVYSPPVPSRWCRRRGVLLMLQGKGFFVKPGQDHSCLVCASLTFLMGLENWDTAARGRRCLPKMFRNAQNIPWQHMWEDGVHCRVMDVGPAE